jgi:hypothetical protein
LDFGGRIAENVPHLFLTPFKSPDTAPSAPDVGPSGPSGRGAAARWTFVLVALALLPLFVWASFDFGVTWDERARHRYGENILEYFRGLRSRASFDVDGGSPYGGLFDLICAAAEQWIPLDRYALRHAINAIFGWIGVLFCGRLAARLFGTWTGVLAMILLAASPRYFADSMNNPKDLPFAALSIAALFYFSKLSPAWPYLSWTTAAKVAVVLALGLNIRAGALLYLAYFGGLLGVFVIAEQHFDWRRLADTAGRLAAVSVATLVLGTAFWPWAQGAPLTRPIEALIGFANYDWSGAVLFEGRNIVATSLPWQYAPSWFLISTPPVVLAGAVLSIALARRQGWTVPTLALWSVAALPVVLVVARRSTLYDGVRHLLFVTPILVALSAAGWSAFLQQRRPWLRFPAAALLAAGLIDVIGFQVRAHPNQAVYFNRLVGGPRGAFARYDLDYWGNCVLQAVAWSATAARLSGRPLAISGNPAHLVQDDAARFREVYFTPLHRPHDLTIRLNRGPREGVIDLAGREDALYRVQTPDGAVLCVVLPGPGFARLQPHLVLPAAAASPHDRTRGE